MNTKYLVEVTEPQGANRAQIVERLTQSFGVDAKKAQSLMKRVPGPVTKPVTEREAQAVAKIFNQTGLIAVVRPAEGGAVAGNAAGSPAGSPAGVQTFETADAPAPRRPRPAGAGQQPLAASAPQPPAPVAFQPPASSPLPPAPAPRPRPAPAEEPLRTPLPPAPTRRPRPATFEDTAPPAPSEPVIEALPAAAPRRAREPRRISLRTKFLSAGILPALLVLLSSLGAILATVPQALSNQLLEAARNPSIAYANAISGLVPGNLNDPAAVQGLQTTLNESRAEFQRQDVAFVLVTDADGNPLAGWYEGLQNINQIPGAINTAIQTQGRRAVARAYLADQNIALGSLNPPSRLIDVAGTRIEVASEAITRNAQALGAVVIGISAEEVDQRVQDVLLRTLLAGVPVVLLAILAAYALSRALSRNIFYLINAADAISRGDLNQNVELQTNDELGDLSRAIERMRASLQEGLERLRRRRR